MEKDLSIVSTQELLHELLRRENTDNSFEIIKETPTSYTFKFYKDY